MENLFNFIQAIKRIRLFAITLAIVSIPGSAQITLNPLPTRVLGQDNLTVAGFSPNLVEGRELDSPLGIALDLSATPPSLYVADTGNNRVLAWKNANTFSNGQKADLIIGQPDFATTLVQGPNHGEGSRVTGLATPVGLAVDGSGNLYVADCGNNRVLRFPRPFAQSSPFPDLVLGQPTFNTNAPNNNGIGAATLNLNPGNPLSAYLTFDPTGNLWVADPGNNRVLRFNASALNASVSGAAAGLVIGQSDFVSSGVASYTTQSVTQILEPTGLAFDSAGSLFVSESTGNQLGRVLVFTVPAQNGQAATRYIGVPSAKPSTPVNALQINADSGAIAVINNSLVVADTADNRLLLYPPLSQWGSDITSQAASGALGQPDLMSGSGNQGLPESGPGTLQNPAAMASSGAELFVADAGNHRVLVFPSNGSSFAPATRVLGQDAMNFNTVNLIEGREFRFSALVSGGRAADAGIAIDNTSTPPHLYVADTYNNRVLGFRDLHAARAGSKADIVIGQPDLHHSELNYPSNQVGTPNQSGLAGPIGLFVDGAGNLYVADSGNGRVLRFPAPFASPQNLPKADLVLGQPNFTLRITDPSATTMAAPYGLAAASGNGLLVSDILHNRVLYFPGNSSTFQTGMAASKVFGQPDFTSTTSGSANDRLASPHHIATDADDRLYVADSGNNRVSIFDRAPTASPDPQAAVTLPGLNVPLGLFVNRTTGEIWVADTNNQHALRFPNFNNLALANFQPDTTFSEAAPIAITQDASGALYVADISNRVVIHYAGLAGINAANFITDRALSPGTIVSLFSLSNQVNWFGTQSVNFNQLPNPLPVPTTLGDTQVLVNNQPAPIYFVGPNQINFLMPNGAPSSGTVTMDIARASTGEVLGSSLIPMAPASPGLFTVTATGSGQVAAINQDGTLNGPDHPAPWGTIVAFFGTGMGAIANAPPDGTPASGLTPTSVTPQVVIGSAFVPAQNVTYSGLAPGLVGVWQVNVQIPDSVPPTTASAPTPVFFLLESIPTGGPAFGRPVTMWVKSR